MKPIPRLISLATSNPKHILHQKDVLPAASEHFSSNNPSFNRLMKVYMNANIETRRSCVDLDWYKKEHTFSERNSLYLEHGLDLIEEVTNKAISSANLTTNDIDAVITVSSSGIATPSLDALLINKMNFKNNTIRLPIFGLGCVGGVVGLSRAANIAQAYDGKNVLLVVLELCGLTFRHNDFSKSNIVATALFADGAAAAIINTKGNGLSITASGEYTWPNSLDIMGWDVKNDGLAVVFSKDIPSLVRKKFRYALNSFLEDNNLKFSDIDNFICHPGGSKVVDALEEVLELHAGELKYSREILREYGNMSAVTVLFVLEKEVLENNTNFNLVSSLGPGFTAGFLTLDARK